MQNIIARRKPHIALVMSLLLPGFGQLYNGEFNKAIWLFLGFTTLTGPAIAAIALHFPSGGMMPLLLLNMIIALGFWIWGMADAWRVGRRKPDYLVHNWQVSGVYALILVVCGFVVLPGVTQYVRAHEVASFRIAGASMEPGLMAHDIVFADKRYNCPGCKYGVRRGDIAIFTYPNDRTQSYVKRIIGLPGDQVLIRGKEILINGKPLTVAEVAAPNGTLITEADADRRWTVHWESKNQPTETLASTVPPGNVFVLGDNRTESRDSRKFGPVPLDDVVGRVRQIWFSADATGIRWDRLGMVPN